MNSEDTDWIYSSDKLKKIEKIKEQREIRNPMDKEVKVDNMDKTQTNTDILSRRDPIFDEPVAHSTHAMLKTELRHSTIADSIDKDVVTKDRVQTGESEKLAKKFSKDHEKDTTPKDIDSIRSKLHSYDPLCGCNKCNKV